VERRRRGRKRGGRTRWSSRWQSCGARAGCCQTPPGMRGGARGACAGCLRRGEGAGRRPSAAGAAWRTTTPGPGSHRMVMAPMARKGTRQRRGLWRAAGGRRRAAAAAWRRWRHCWATPAGGTRHGRCGTLISQTIRARRRPRAEGGAVHGASSSAWSGRGARARARARAGRGSGRLRGAWRSWWPSCTRFPAWAARAPRAAAQRRAKAPRPGAPWREIPLRLGRLGGRAWRTRRARARHGNGWGGSRGCSRARAPLSLRRAPLCRTCRRTGRTRRQN